MRSPKKFALASATSAPNIPQGLFDADKEFGAKRGLCVTIWKRNSLPIQIMAIAFWLSFGSHGSAAVLHGAEWYEDGPYVFSYPITVNNTTHYYTGSTDYLISYDYEQRSKEEMWQSWASGTSSVRTTVPAGAHTQEFEKEVNLQAGWDSVVVAVLSITQKIKETHSNSEFTYGPNETYSLDYRWLGDEIKNGRSFLYTEDRSYALEHDDISAGIYNYSWDSRLQVFPIPIPGALLLFGSALAGLGVFGLHHRRSIPS
jgi:hypothetical protein